MFFEFYQSNLQSAYALWLVPALFLAYLALTRKPGATSPDARFVRAYCAFFAFETILDAFVTGTFTQWTSLGGTLAGTILLVFFVLLGDFRVFLLLLRLAQPALALGRLLGKAALWTLPVPLVALSLEQVLDEMVGPLPENLIWLLYEMCFLIMALYLRTVAIPRWLGAGRPARLAYLQSVATYVALYYALWATADVIILFLGLDVGWLLRVIPNQLYYAFYVPLVFFRFFASEDQASTSTSTHASR